MAEFQTFRCRYSEKNRMDLAQILQGLSYVVCSTILPKAVAIGSFIPVFGKPPLYTNSLLLGHKEIWNFFYNKK